MVMASSQDFTPACFNADQVHAAIEARSEGAHNSIGFGTINQPITTTRWRS
jgi:hypothetical protein